MDSPERVNAPGVTAGSGRRHSLLQVDHQVAERLVVGRRQQQQHLVDRLQPLVGAGDFCGGHTAEPLVRRAGGHVRTEAVTEVGLQTSPLPRKEGTSGNISRKVTSVAWPASFFLVAQTLPCLPSQWRACQKCHCHKL